MITKTPFEALLECKTIAGSQSAMARDLGLSQTAIWKWFQSSKRMATEYVLKAEAKYGVSRHALRPDIYPIEPSPAQNKRFYAVDQSPHKCLAFQRGYDGAL